MRGRAVKPHEIPLRLLKQKKAWDLRVFYEIAVRDPDWWAFLFDEGDEDDPVAVVILADSPLYNAVEVQTLIVDKAWRTDARVAEMVVWAHDLAMSKARALGRQYTGWATPDPERFLKFLGHPPRAEVLEHVVREEV